MSRLFATKAIEDAFCVDLDEPLIEKELWLFDTDAYDDLDAEGTREEVFRRARALSRSSNVVVQRFARYGFFFNWIEGYVDPVILRALLETFSVHDFSELEGDLLGRFYELYAQSIDRGRRRALGQYYTPQEIVEFMWRTAIDLVRERGETERLTVLDPAMGSATFLTEGARALSGVGVERFWERLTGFDVAAQVLGIAHVNVYMAILSRLTPEEALEVEDLRLYATDALDYEQGGHLLQVLPLIPDEGQRSFLEQRIAISNRAKREGSYRLVIGNPPYHNNSALTLSQVAEDFPRLLGSSVEAGGAQQRNIRDDYAWFFAAADRYVADHGLICFIVSDSFATRSSYRYFRAELARHYHVRRLVRLGPHLFPDVGFRTSFAILVLEKREALLELGAEAEAIAYHDLRPLTDGAPASALGTPEDPRLSRLRAVARVQAGLGPPELHAPEEATGFSFYPATRAAGRFASGLVAPLYERGRPRVFATKWPGIITAFDALFKGRSREELEGRISSFFSLCREEGLSPAEFERRLMGWGERAGFKDKEMDRLLSLGFQVRSQPDLVYDPGKVKRSFSGSIPSWARWYPPMEFVHYLYYEPLLFVPRNVNPGKPVGWGTMNQWRVPRSHVLSPKLVYTTAARPENGYAAFVTEGEWYVKLHGGTNQQFHYTGLTDPTGTVRPDGGPNNLNEPGEVLLGALAQAGAEPEALLHYVAGVWNSSLAAELLSGASTTLRPTVKIPEGPNEIDLTATIAANARTARDLVRLAQYLGDDARRVPAGEAESRASKVLLAELGLERSVERRRGFRDTDVYAAPSGVADRARRRLAATEAEIDELVEALYP